MQLYQVYTRVRIAIHTAGAIILILVPVLFMFGALVGASTSFTLSQAHRVVLGSGTLKKQERSRFVGRDSCRFVAFLRELFCSMKEKKHRT
jgi:hypothetical protein